jgi:pimeloyl-ACP methyl ester carboxylesterase
VTRGRFVAGGCALDYVDEGAGTPVLWQHGLGATQAQAAEVFPTSPTLRRITLECRGHAGSELGDPQDLSIARFADDALALLDHRGIERAVVGGISLGAAIALRLAAFHPQRVAGLILARPAWLGDDVPERMAIYRDVAALLASHGAEEGLRRLEAGEGYRRLSSESPDNAASMRKLFLRENPATTVALLGRLPSQGSGVSRERMRGLELPTLVIANERDYVHPVAMATETAGLIPGAKLVIIPAKDASGAYLRGFKAALQEFLATRCAVPA